MRYLANYTTGMYKLCDYAMYLHCAPPPPKINIEMLRSLLCRSSRLLSEQQFLPLLLAPRLVVLRVRHTPSTPTRHQWMNGSCVRKLSVGASVQQSIRCWNCDREIRLREDEDARFLCSCEKQVVLPPTTSDYFRIMAW